MSSSGREMTEEEWQKWRRHFDWVDWGNDDRARGARPSITGHEAVAEEVEQVHDSRNRADSIQEEREISRGDSRTVSESRGMDSQDIEGPIRCRRCGTKLEGESEPRAWQKDKTLCRVCGRKP